MIILKKEELNVGKNLILSISEGYYAVYIQQEHSAIKDDTMIPFAVNEEIVECYSTKDDNSLEKAIEKFNNIKNLLKS